MDGMIFKTNYIEDGLEYRTVCYGGLAITPFEIKMIKERLQMDQYYKEQKEKMELERRFYKLLGKLK